MNEPTIKYDPVEQTVAYLSIADELEAKIEEKLRGEPQGDGFCYIYWSVKERILREDYGIEWDPPTALNPHTRFD